MRSPETDPCFYCNEHTPTCHGTCRRHKIAVIKKELKKKKDKKADF